jgi:predicted transcriptional regulator
MSSRRRISSIGDRELELLRFIGEQGQITVGQAAEAFGRGRGLARSTVLTMMERLRKKGHLRRRLIEGVYQYSPRTAPRAALQQVVQAFIDRTLGGSITPFVAYLSERDRFDEGEIAELEALLAQLHQRRGRAWKR